MGTPYGIAFFYTRLLELPHNLHKGIQEEV